MLYIRDMYNHDMKKRKKNGWIVIMININRSKSQETRKEKRDDSCKWLYEHLLLYNKKKKGKKSKKVSVAFE